MLIGTWTTVRVEVDHGIAWVELHRPEKRNAMNPTLNAEMVDVLLELDANDDVGVLVLTGAGDSFSAGMDLKEYFREVDQQAEHVQRRVRRDANYWQWRILRTYAKPTIAMVNGWCFGGAFTPLAACDLAVAADEATFGLSEINVLRAAKLGFKHAQTMSWDTAEDYLYAKLEQSQFLDRERGREQGLQQFLDDKSIRPGLETYRRP